MATRFPRASSDLNPLASFGESLILGPSTMSVTHKPLADIRAYHIAARKTIVFTENNPAGLFYINGEIFDPTKPAHYFAKAGTVELWTIVNKTHELHQFHIHQIHFLVLDEYLRNPRAPLDFQDSVVVPYAKPDANGKDVPGTVTLLMDFTDPIIRGTIVFHCHILEHEDGGMMQKITVR
jgi:suppressor of ftsI